MRKLLVLCTFLLLSFYAFAQGHSIRVELTDTSLSEIYLGYHYADKQYIVDTAKWDNGSYHFSGEEELTPGVYLVVFPPKNLYLEILIDKDHQDLKLSTSTENLAGLIDVKSKGQNKDFYEYISFLRNQREQSDYITKEIKKTPDSLSRVKLKSAILKLDEEVRAKQDGLLTKYNDQMIAVVIKSGLQVEIPEMKELSGNDLKKAQYLYYKEHYFDNLDLSDDRLIRTPFINSKVSSYVSKLTPQIPDSIGASIDRILGMMTEGSDLYKHYLIKFINEYSASKVVGMDAVFVHLADMYYRTGKASWTTEESLSKILKRSTTLKPLLLGKKAPDFEYEKQDGTKHRLYDVVSEYTVVLFWDPDCGVCKKAMPEAVNFSKSEMAKGVTMLGICTKREKDVGDCWEDIEKKGLQDWTVGYDPYGMYKPLYDVTSTPMIYVLDADKTIISKRIAAKQLEEVMSVLKDELSRPVQNK